jgi:hypothetical protein
MDGLSTDKLRLLLHPVDDDGGKDTDARSNDDDSTSEDSSESKKIDFRYIDGANSDDIDVGEILI